MFALVTLALSTLVSEDLACVAAGVLIARGQVSAFGGILACAIGIFAGDFGLWALGRFGGDAARRLPWLAGRLGAPAVDAGARWLDRHAGTAIVASRFTPGARLPLFIAAGLARMSPVRFGCWTAIAVTMWTPAVVLASARAGQAGAQAGAAALWPLLAAGATVFVITRAAQVLASPPARASSLLTRIQRLRRWEFWPSWLFYAPVACWVVLLALRYRGLTTITTSNPGIPDGGLVGESKFDILDRLPAEYTIPTERFVPGDGPDALGEALSRVERRAWSFPLVVKPDVGQRGAGVRLVRTIGQLTSHLTTAGGALIVQPFHEGPYEAGIFYYRMPGEMHGRVFSVTDKQFPAVVGDGVSTLRQLIASHPRYRFQSRLFLSRHAAQTDRTPAVDERVPLGIAGNHAQGAVFRDGAHLLTPELEARIDGIARHYPGFFIGRFDVRYRDVTAFMAGRDLAIVELNGATAESTDIYDPDRSLLSAYRVLFRQWSLVFAIGAANRRDGAVPTPMRRLVRLVWGHLVTPVTNFVSD